MSTAAERIATFSTSLAYDDIPSDVIEAAKLHVLDTLGVQLRCERARHRDRRPHGHDGAGRRSSGVGDRLRREHSRCERGLRERDALPRPSGYDDTHSDSVAHVSTVVVPVSAAVGEADDADGQALLTAIVAGNSEIVTRVGMAASGAFHKRGLPPDGDLRHLRRHGGSDAPRGLRRAKDSERARNRRLVHQALRLPGRRNGDEADARSVGGPRFGAGRVSQPLGAEGPPSVLEGRFGLYHAFLGAEKGEVDVETQSPGPRRALGDAADRVQAMPGVPLHARLAERNGEPPRAAVAPRGQGRRRDDPRSRRLARAGAGKREDRAAHGLRGGSSASSTRPPPCSSRPRRRCRRTRRNRSPIETLELAKRVRYEVKDYPVPGCVPSGVRIRTRVAGRSRPTSRTSKAGPRTR